MKLYRTWAIIVRHWYLFPRTLDRITDAFLWPILDVIVLGLTSEWMTQSNERGPALMQALITSAILFRIMWQSSYEVSINLLEECWNRNLSNLWSTPITKSEWILGNLLVGLFKLILVLAVTALAVKFMYAMNLFVLGWAWVPFAACLVLFGWSLGFLASGLLLYWGVRAQALSWTLGFIIAPLSATYFPLSFLPEWAQTLAEFIPSMHIFEAMRAIILENRFDIGSVWTSLGLNLAYICASILFLNYMFEHTRQRGFDHLE